MSFPYANEHSASVTLFGVASEATTSPMLKALAYPGFEVPRAVDVSGMELAVAIGSAAATTAANSIASGTTTVVVKPYDGATSASAATDNNELFAVTDFSNSLTGGWTAHQGRKAVGTSTTDLDADDWVNIDVAANISGAAGIGELIVAAFFLYGVPGGPG